MRERLFPAGNVKTGGRLVSQSLKEKHLPAEHSFGQLSPPKEMAHVGDSYL